MKRSNNNPREVSVISTGIANVASVLAAFQRVGWEPRLCDSPGEVRQSEYVVLPGVGSFGHAARELARLQLREAITERIEQERPTLAICLGMQILCLGSEESPQARGLGCVPGTATRFDQGHLVPHMGWNRVVPVASDLMEPGHAYFANSYRVQSLPAGWSGAVSVYDGEFVSAIERGPVLACQFHPELSGDWGEALLRRWLERGREA